MSSGHSAPDLSTRLAAALLEWHEGKAVLGGVSIEKLAAAHGTPLYLYDADVLLSQFQRLRRALPTPIEIYYSIKANPHPSVITPEDSHGQDD